ncbi:hypothetical protein AURDEDRAFT_130761 [Auricularia subglabra TFB-10046 SS5]|uniref:Ig-like domain-containing protein n=1 Tax=Auricularia subglabra (strain TFB-10046 / SS5) TaxID=717982 RepID=J0D7W7_AURST|nr:hypothetical protein AURDEDRAFT_130761 [Auricularia subglabra TFB-10046 SS5]
MPDFFGLFILAWNAPFWAQCLIILLLTGAIGALMDPEAAAAPPPTARDPIGRLLSNLGLLEPEAAAAPPPTARIEGWLITLFGIEPTPRLTFERLPAEIIAEILLSTPFSFQEKVAISSVSRSVRNVAINLSSFWSQIEVRNPPDLIRAPLLLKRSRSALLEVDLDGTGMGAEEAEICSRLATLIIPHRSRIRILLIMLPTLAPVHELVHSESVFEELVEAVITESAFRSDLFLVSIVAPRLRVLRVYGYITPRLESLSYTGLRELLLHLPTEEMSTELLNAVFNGCTSLRELVLGTYPLGDEEAVTPLGSFSSVPPQHLEFVILNLTTSLCLALLEYLPSESINIIQLYSWQRFLPQEGDSVHPMLRCLATGGSRLFVETPPENESQWLHNSLGPEGSLAFWLTGTDERVSRPEDTWYNFYHGSFTIASQSQNQLRGRRGRGAADRVRGLVLAHDDWQAHGCDVWEHLCRARAESPHFALHSSGAWHWHTLAFARHPPHGANIAVSLDLAVVLEHLPGSLGSLPALRIPSLAAVRLLHAKCDGALLNRGVAYLAARLRLSEQPAVEICVCAALPPTDWSTARALAAMQFSMDKLCREVRQGTAVTIRNHWVNGPA